MFVILAVLVAAENGFNSDCGHLRVRKTWESLAEDEKQLFREAIAMAMKDGGYYDFANIHQDKQSADEGHYTCAFGHWHRAIMLAFENYLRDLDDKFKCLTIPFWDVSESYAQGEPYINSTSALTEICGDPEMSATFSYPRLDFWMNDQKVEGYRFDHFPCNESQRHVLRGPLHRSYVPDSLAYRRIRDLFVFDGVQDNFTNFHNRFYFEQHNSLHEAMGGVMSTMFSTDDPFFWIWHSTVDSYYHLHQLCKLGPDPLTEEQFESPLAFGQCSMHNKYRSPLVYDNMTLYGKLGDMRVKATEHPKVGKYFRDIGTKYVNLLDIRQLGESSYRYEYPWTLRAILGEVFDSNSCPGSKSRIQEISLHLE